MANAAATKTLGEAAAPTRIGGNAGSQRAFAANLGAEAVALRGVHNGRGAPATDRLRVYRNNVIVSLSEALRAAFPTVERLVGEEFFHNAAVAYAMAHKPRTPLMFEYGDTFADFLAELPGVAPYPFVPEAARIERARIDATHAADAAPLAADALATVPPEALDGLTLTPHPAARLVACAAGGLGAWQTNQDPPRPATPAAAALVTRPGVEVIVSPLDAAAAEFTGALFTRQTLGDAAGKAGETLDLAATLALLLTAGAFAAMEPGPRTV